MPSDHDDDEDFGSNDDFLDEQAAAGEKFLQSEDPLHPSERKRAEESEAAKAKRVLLATGYDEDELRVLFKDDKALIEFYHEQRRGVHTADGKDVREQVEAAESDAEPEDDFDLPDDSPYLRSKSVVPAQQGGKTAALEDTAKGAEKKKPAPKKKPTPKRKPKK